MKIAILTSGRLPVPAVSGGAVETMTDYYLQYNEQTRHHDITVYSVAPDVHIEDTAFTHYVYYHLDTLWARIKARLHKHSNKMAYYDPAIEYFLKLAISDIQKKQFDCIVLENRPGYALQVSARTNVPIINHLNNDYLNTGTRFGEEIKSCSSLVLTCSDFIRQRAAEVSSRNNIPCKTLFNAIDTGVFINAKTADRASVGLRHDDFVIVYSGRLIPEKGVLQLIEAVKQLSDIPNIRLLIVGASFYGHDKQKSSFAEKLSVASEPIRDKVIFTGFVDYSNMPSYLKMADVAVLPSMWDEPFGLTVVEAMSAGLPLVTTHSGGIHEICSGCALIVSRDNIVAQLSDSIRYLHDNPAEARQLGLKGQQRSLKFDKGVFAKTFFDMIEEHLYESKNSCQP